MIILCENGYRIIDTSDIKVINGSVYGYVNHEYIKLEEFGVDKEDWEKAKKYIKDIYEREKK